MRELTIKIFVDFDICNGQESQKVSHVNELVKTRLMFLTNVTKGSSKLI